MTATSAVLKKFQGLNKALVTASQIQSYSLDLGMALGLLKQCRPHDRLDFHVDSGGYRAASLPPEEWHELAGTHRFSVKPRRRKNGLFHSKAWFFERGVLLGSCNLSIREARYNLNFWCWVPDGEWRSLAQRLGSGSCTVCWDLDTARWVLRGPPRAALRACLSRFKVTALVVTTPQPPSKKLLSGLTPIMANSGSCTFFLGDETHALKELPKRKLWSVRNFVPDDKSIGLHGKSLYAEWEEGGELGAALYVGSANFTRKGYDDGNIEAGILIQAHGNRQTAELQRALRALLGASGAPSKSKDAWATERFNGSWRRVEAMDSKTARISPEQTQEDLALARFVEGLKAKSNRLSFPASYGSRKIQAAQLSLTDGITRWWRTPHARRFAGIIWAPGICLKLTLEGGSKRSVGVPPLDGLMGGTDAGAGLLEALLTTTAVRGGGNGGGPPVPSLAQGTSAIYTDSRVLFPWRTLVESRHAALLKRPGELQRASSSLDEMLQEAELEPLMRRKLEIIRFCLNCLGGRSQ